MTLSDAEDSELRTYLAAPDGPAPRRPEELVDELPRTARDHAASVLAFADALRG